LGLESDYKKNEKDIELDNEKKEEDAKTCDKKANMIKENIKNID
jgi:hypothetical protein